MKTEFLIRSALRTGIILLAVLIPAFALAAGPNTVTTSDIEQAGIISNSVTIAKPAMINDSAPAAKLAAVSGKALDEVVPEEEVVVQAPVAGEELSYVEAAPVGIAMVAIVLVIATFGAALF